MGYRLFSFVFSFIQGCVKKAFRFSFFAFYFEFFLNRGVQGRSWVWRFDGGFFGRVGYEWQLGVIGWVGMRGLRLESGLFGNGGIFGQWEVGRRKVKRNDGFDLGVAVVLGRLGQWVFVGRWGFQGSNVEIQSDLVRKFGVQYEERVKEKFNYMIFFC